MTDIAAAAGQRADYAPRDFLSEDGAKELKRRIEQFWERKLKSGPGGAVMVSIDKMDGVPKSGRYTIYCVRSNLVRGLPAAVAHS